MPSTHLLDHLEAMIPGIPEPTFLNRYWCGDCWVDWTDIWSRDCEDECPDCNTSCSPPPPDSVEA